MPRPTLPGVNETDLLAALARAAASGHGTQTFLATAVQSLHGTIGSATLGIWMLADGRLRLKGLAAPDDQTDLDEQAFVEAFGDLPIVGRLPGHQVLRAGVPLAWKRDDPQLEPAVQELLTQLGADSLVGVPIVVGGLPVGVALLTLGPEPEERLEAIGHLLKTPLAIFAILYRNEQLREADAERAIELETLARAVDASPELILLLDEAGRILLTNPACIPFLGHPPDEIQGRNLLDFVLSEPGTIDAEALSEHLADPKSVPLPPDRDIHLTRHPSGTTVCSMVTVEIRGSARRQMVALLRDVSEERQREEERVRHRKLKAVGRVAAGLGHEINTPLTSISHLAELLAGEGLPEPAGEFAAAIRQQVRQAGTVIQNLQTFAREAELECSWTNMGQLLERLVRDARPQLDPAGIQVELRTSPDLPRIWADRHQLRTVFHNLLVNARSALSRHAPEHDRSIQLTLGPGPHDGIRIQVEDSGPGLPDDVLQNMFIPFATFGQDGEKPGSRGLGLAVSHGIVLKHGGSIEGRNVSGGGARFDIELPRIPPGASASGSPPPNTPPAARSIGGRALKRILVVEDEPILASAVARALTRWEWEPVVAHSAEEAIEHLNNDPDDWAAILSDFRMPGIGGRGLFDFVRQERPELAGRFVFTTGDLVDPDTHAFISQSGRPVLMKPYELSELDELIRTVAGEE